MSLNLAPLYEVTRGETLRLALRVKSGMVVGDEAIRSVGKKIDNRHSKPPGADEPELFPMDATFAAASGDEPARWYLTLTDENSSLLEAGFYAVDARIPLADGSVEYASHVVIEVVERVTGPAP